MNLNNVKKYKNEFIEKVTGTYEDGLYLTWTNTRVST